MFVLKLVVLLQLKDHPGVSGCRAGHDRYVDLARRVLGGDLGLGPALYHVSPLYIYFLAAILAVFHSFTALRVIQIVLGTASVGFIFFTARAWFGERAAWIAAVLAAFTGLFTFYEVLILQSSIDAFLTSAGLYALTRALADLPPEGGSHESRADANLASARLIWGVQTLNRPNVMIAALGVALVMLIVTRRVRPAAVLVAGLLSGISPVAIRNIVVSHQWSLVSSHGGLNFYIGNSERATGFYQTVPGITPTIAGQEKDTPRRGAGARTSGRGCGGIELLLRPRTDDRGPSCRRPRALRAEAGYAFHAQHVPLPHSYPFYACDTPTALRFYAIGPWLLMPLGLAGLLFAAPAGRRREYIIWASFVPAYAAAVAVFFVAERYRLPLMVPLCATSGAAIDMAIRAIRQRRARPLLMPLAIAMLAAFSNWRINASDGRWWKVAHGAATGDSRRYEEADRWAGWLDAHAPPRPARGAMASALLLA